APADQQRSAAVALAGVHAAGGVPGAHHVALHVARAVGGAAAAVGHGGYGGGAQLVGGGAAGAGRAPAEDAGGGAGRVHGGVGGGDVRCRRVGHRRGQRQHGHVVAPGDAAVVGVDPDPADPGDGAVRSVEVGASAGHAHAAGGLAGHAVGGGDDLRGGDQGAAAELVLRGVGDLHHERVRGRRGRRTADDGLGSGARGRGGDQRGRGGGSGRREDGGGLLGAGEPGHGSPRRVAGGGSRGVGGGARGPANRPRVPGERHGLTLRAPAHAPNEGSPYGSWAG